MRAKAVFLKRGVVALPIKRFSMRKDTKKTGRWRLSQLPVMTKENYVKKYSIEERCYDGRIPAAGVVIDESSGSSGMPQ